MILRYSKILQMISLYRGLTSEFDQNFNLSEAPAGYSYWTDNPDLAKQYAGSEGFVYRIELPLSEMGSAYIDDEGERPLFFKSDRQCSFNNICGNEYLLYHNHERFPREKITLFKK